MSRTLVTRAGRLTAGALVVAALGGSLFAAQAQAQASPDAPGRPLGTVNAQTGVNERMHPSTDSSVRGVLRHRVQIGLRCKVRAQDVSGNNLWYQLRDRSTWVTAKYIEGAGDVPFCRSLTRSAVDQSVESRNAMG
ncbi:hypothetical protein GCM10020221_07550 [Streptomyces thioluteus]|uniref:SH3 domain-containing protein n=1 Tax=Streptomyces thioluteus TaxID=66431 RepID=A0ABP6IZ28_STRTU